MTDDLTFSVIYFVKEVLSPQIWKYEKDPVSQVFVMPVQNQWSIVFPNMSMVIFSQKTPNHPGVHVLIVSFDGPWPDHFLRRICDTNVEIDSQEIEEILYRRFRAPYVLKEFLFIF